MKKLLLIFLIFSSESFSKDFINDIIGFYDDFITTSQNLRSKNALIKTKADLKFYSSLKDALFPLNILDNKSKKIFIDSLRFNEKGLTTFNYTVFNKLSEDDTYKILSLFGAGNTSHLIHKPSNGSKMLPPGGSDDHIGYSCVGRADCDENQSHICMSSC